MQMGKWMTAMGAVLLFGLTGCARYEPAGAFEEPVALTETESGTSAGLERNAAEESTEEGAAALTEKEPEPIAISTISRPEPVKVRGIYVSAYVAGTGNRMDEILNQMEGTGLNAVVIDLKDDEGRITCEMDSPLVNEIGASRVLIQDMPGLIESLKERGIYPIARVVAFRDPYLAEQKPEWSLHMTDGSIYRDGNGLAWVNPYRQEVWDYLVEVGKKAGELGFAEVQFDYVRFSVDSGAEGVTFAPEDTQGRSKTEAISQFMDYAYNELAREGLYVSADVFGTIIRSGQDAQAVGQDYREMAGRVDYLCPMIYPSHYGDGSFGIEHPDTQPYDTVYQALLGSREALEGPGDGNENAGDESTGAEGGRQAVVRPWLQDFTASYLDHYIDYGDEEVRAQIQAVYDAGYEEWLLWDAGVSYHFGGAAEALVERTAE